MLCRRVVTLLPKIVKLLCGGLVPAEGAPSSFLFTFSITQPLSSSTPASRVRLAHLPFSASRTLHVATLDHTFLFQFFDYLLFHSNCDYPIARMQNQFPTVCQSGFMTLLCIPLGLFWLNWILIDPICLNGCHLYALNEVFQAKHWPISTMATHSTLDYVTPRPCKFWKQSVMIRTAILKLLFKLWAFGADRIVNCESYVMQHGCVPDHAGQVEGTSRKCVEDGASFSSPPLMYPLMWIGLVGMWFFTYISCLRPDAPNFASVFLIRFFWWSLAIPAQITSLSCCHLLK